MPFAEAVGLTITTPMASGTERRYWANPEERITPGQERHEWHPPVIQP